MPPSSLNATETCNYFILLDVTTDCDDDSAARLIVDNILVHRTAFPSLQI